MANLQTLPAGWDCRYDESSGKYYYINHYTKTTTWEDPRPRLRSIHGPSRHLQNAQSEYIPMQHGSPDMRRNYVYPSQPSPIPAFQMPAHMSPKSIPLQDMKSRVSPLTLRSSKVQDSSFTALTDTDAAVVKISAMFPTVSDTHIRLLLKKYHNREALVISALKVEKNPITTPGPFATPPPQRNIHHPGVHAPLHMTPPLGFYANSRGGSPIFRPGSGSNSTYTGSPRVGDGSRSSPRPHSSPKLKLRYMKSIFPEADETLILETLQNNDHNIQKVSDILKEMGYNKKDTVKVAQQKMEAKKEQKRKEEEEEIEERPPSPQIKVKSTEEKNQVKRHLQGEYKDVPEHLISIALESVNFDETRANQILQIMIQEDTQAADSRKRQEDVDSSEIDADAIPSTSAPIVSNISVSQSRQSLKSLLKEKSDKENSTFSRVIEEHDPNLQSNNLASTKGHNPLHAKGPNEKLLLEDYIKWQGASAGLRRGPQGLAKGPNVHLLSEKKYQPCGPNTELRKGPKRSLAKGSIFSQLKNALVGESRGK